MRYAHLAPENVRAATRQRLEAAFPDLSHKRLTDINPWLVEKWRLARLKAGIQPATINRDLTALKACLSMAVTWGELDERPLADVKPCKVDNKGVVRYLSAAEDTRLEQALLSAPEYLQVMVVLAKHCGLRRGELFNLKWSDVNPHTKQLTVTGDTTKSGSTRHIPLNAVALTALRTWKHKSQTT